MNNLARLIESRIWRRDKKGKKEASAEPSRLLHVAAMDDHKRGSIQQQRHRSSSPHSTTKSSKTTRTDPTLDHSLLSESSRHAASDELSTPESLHHGHFRQSTRQRSYNPHRYNHNYDDDDQQVSDSNSSISSRRTNDDERTTSPPIPSVVSGSSSDAAHRYTSTSQRPKDTISSQLRDTILGRGSISHLFDQEIMGEKHHYAGNTVGEHAVDDIKSRSGAPTVSGMTQASTQVATNRAIDLALRRIEQMQVQLQQEHTRLDALVAREAVAFAANQKQDHQQTQTVQPHIQRRHEDRHVDSSVSLHLERDAYTLQDPVVEVAPASDDASIFPSSLQNGRGMTAPPMKRGRLGQHVQKMQAKFTPSEYKSYQSKSISSSVGVEIDLEPSSNEAAKRKFHQARSHDNTFRAEADSTPFRNQLLLPALSSPMPPPAIKRYVFHRGGGMANSAVSNLSPDPVFCVSPGISRASTSVSDNVLAADDICSVHKSQAALKQTIFRDVMKQQSRHKIGNTLVETGINAKPPLTPAPRCTITAEAPLCNMMSPDSIFAGTFDSSLQPSLDASDRATFMQRFAPVSRHNASSLIVGMKCPTTQLHDVSSFVPLSIRVQRPVETQASVPSVSSVARPYKDHVTRQSISTDFRVVSGQESAMNNPLAHHLSKQFVGKSVGAKNQWSALGSKQMAFDSTDYEDDEASVKSLKERFEAPSCPAGPSTVTLMRRKFETKKRVVEAGPQFKMTLSTFDSRTSKGPQNATRRHLPQLQVADCEQKSRLEGVKLEMIGGPLPCKLASLTIRDRIRAFEAATRPLAMATPSEGAKSWRNDKEARSITSLSKTEKASQLQCSRQEQSITIGLEHALSSADPRLKTSAAGVDTKTTSNVSLKHHYQSAGLSKHRKGAPAQRAMRALLPSQKSGIEVYRESLSQSNIANSGSRLSSAKTKSSAEQIVHQHKIPRGRQRPHRFTSTARHLSPDSCAKSDKMRSNKAQSESATELRIDEWPHQHKHAMLTPTLELDQLDVPSVAATNDALGNVSDALPVESPYAYGSSDELKETKSNSDALEHASLLKPIPVKLDCKAIYGPKMDQVAISMTSFRPVSAPISDTSLSRFSHSSLAVSGSLLKFARKARIAASSSKLPSRSNFGVHRHEVHCSLSGMPVVDRHADSSSEMVSMTELVTENDLLPLRNQSQYPYNSPYSQQEQAPYMLEEAKDQENTDGRSIDESSNSDGVTLNLSVADVSILTTPTALVSKAEGDRVQHDIESRTSASTGDITTEDDASSNQSSEAAVPLLRQSQGAETSSDDYSASANSFFEQRAHQASDWVTAPNVLPSDKGTNEPTNTTDSVLDTDWDVSRIDSLFHGVTDCRQNSMFNIDTDSQIALSTETRGTSLQAENCSTTRAKTPTRSNKSVHLVPTTRQYASYRAHCQIRVFEARQETQDLRRVSIAVENAGRPGMAHADSSANSRKTTHGFPLSRQLRSQAIRPADKGSSMHHNPPDDLRQPRVTVPCDTGSALRRFSEEQSRLMTRLQRLREARIKRGVACYPYESEMPQKQSWSIDFDDNMSRSTQSSTKFGGPAFTASLDLD